MLKKRKVFDQKDSHIFVTFSNFKVLCCWLIWFKRRVSTKIHLIVLHNMLLGQNEDGIDSQQNKSSSVSIFVILQPKPSHKTAKSQRADRDPQWVKIDQKDHLHVLVASKQPRNAM